LIVPMRCGKRMLKPQVPLEFDHHAGSIDYFARPKIRVPNAAFRGATIGTGGTAVITGNG
jgi:hypothetical protein